MLALKATGVDEITSERCMAFWREIQQAENLCRMVGLGQKVWLIRKKAKDGFIFSYVGYC